MNTMSTATVKDQGQKVYVCPEPECHFWAKLVNVFHAHAHLVHRIGETSFKCSACKYVAHNLMGVQQHQKVCRDAGDLDHINAYFVIVQPLPNHRYACTIRLLDVPENMVQGELTLNAPRSDCFDNQTQQPRFGEPTSCAVEVETADAKTIQDAVIPINSEKDEVLWRAEISHLDADIQKGFRSIAAARQKSDAGPKQLLHLNAVQRATVSKIEELQTLKKEIASRLASLNSQIDELKEKELVLDRQLSTKMEKRALVAQKRKEVEEALVSLPDEISGLIADQKVLIQKNQTAKKRLVILGIEKETKDLLDQLVS